MPEIFRRLHPQFKTPWLSLLVFAGIVPILLLLPGDVNFVGTLYSLGATLSFTVAHASLVRLRMSDATTGFVPPYRARPNLTLRGVDWPLFAIFGGIATGALVPRHRDPEPHDPLGRARLDGRSAFVGYAIYRRRVVERGAARDGQGAAGDGCRARARVSADPRPDRARTPLRRRVRRRAPAREGARRTGDCAHGDRGAARPAARRRAARARGDARTASSTRRSAIGDSYDVRVTPRLVRGRSASVEIVAEANRRDAEIIVLGSPRKALTQRRRGVFGATVDRVMRNAPCRVMVTGVSGPRVGWTRMTWYRQCRVRRSPASSSGSAWPCSFAPRRQAAA